MEDWEQRLARELQRKSSPAAAPDAEPAAPDALGAAFRDAAERVGASVERVAKAVGVPAEIADEPEAGRIQWTVGPRRLRLRLDREAAKFFVSVESDAGLELCELALEDGRVVTGGAPADVDQVVQRFVTLLFRGR
jgi:hypothetical protein